MSIHQWKQAVACCLAGLALAATATALCGHGKCFGESDLRFGGDNPLRFGDLLFVGAQPQQSTSTMDDAIASATGSYTHVAIVLSPSCIIDATPRHGVAIRSMAAFLQECDGCALAARRVREDICLDTTFLRRTATTLAGKDYDLYFLPANDKYYCSELVQACYRRCDGTPLFLAAPMNFLAPDSTLPPYWQQLYDSLQCPVPQGIPGTNPTAMAQSPCLSTLNP